MKHVAFGAQGTQEDLSWACCLLSQVTLNLFSSILTADSVLDSPPSTKFSQLAPAEEGMPLPPNMQQGS